MGFVQPLLQTIRTQALIVAVDADVPEHILKMLGAGQGRLEGSHLLDVVAGSQALLGVGAVVAQPGRPRV